MKWKSIVNIIYDSRNGGLSDRSYQSSLFVLYGSVAVLVSSPATDEPRASTSKAATATSVPRVRKLDELSKAACNSLSCSCFPYISSSSGLKHQCLQQRKHLAHSNLTLRSRLCLVFSFLLRTTSLGFRMGRFPRGKLIVEQCNDGIVVNFHARNSRTRGSRPLMSGEIIRAIDFTLHFVIKTWSWMETGTLRRVSRMSPDSFWMYRTSLQSCVPAWLHRRALLITNSTSCYGSVSATVSKNRNIGVAPEMLENLIFEFIDISINQSNTEKPWQCQSNQVHRPSIQDFWSDLPY